MFFTVFMFILAAWAFLRALRRELPSREDHVGLVMVGLGFTSTGLACLEGIYGNTGVAPIAGVAAFAFLLAGTIIIASGE